MFLEQITRQGANSLAPFSNSIHLKDDKWNSFIDRYKWAVWEMKAHGTLAIKLLSNI